MPLTIELFDKSELLLLALLAGLDEDVVNFSPLPDPFLLDGVIFLINLVVSLLSFTVLLLPLGVAEVALTGVECLLLESGGAGDSLSLLTGVGLASVHFVARCIGCSVSGASSSGALHQLGCPYSELPLLLDTITENRTTFSMHCAQALVA